MSSFQIRQDDLCSDAVRELLEMHVGGMRDDSPPGLSFALDLSGLRQSNVTVWSAWDGNELAGIAALKQLDDDAGELKSMRTAPAYLRQGVAAALLAHIVEVARQRRLRRLSLETGTGAAFAAAVSLYRKAGFVRGEAFADYVETEFNHFYHLSLHDRKG